MEQKSMKDLTTTPTSELLAEWGKQQQVLKYWREFPAIGNECSGAGMRQGDALRSIATIAAELDRRCEDAQITIIDGVFCFHVHPILGDGKFAKWRWIQHVIGRKKRLLASELRDLLTWLIQERGNG